MGGRRSEQEADIPTATTAVTAASEPEGQAAVRAWPRVDWAIAVPAAATLALMTWGISARAYSGDEADTMSAVSRSLPQLWHMFGHVDAVHGLYYVLLWPVVRVLGPSAAATRLPSAVAMAAAAAGVSAIGHRTRSRRAGLYAGLVFAVLPSVTSEGQDARPYAMITAAVVLASYLFLRAAADPRPRRLAVYGASLLLVGYLQIFGLLIVLAHAVTLLARHAGTRDGGQPGGAAVSPPPARATWGWLLTVTAVLAAVTPLVAASWAQRAMEGWLTKPSWAELTSLASYLAVGSTLSAAVMAALTILGAARGDGARRRDQPGWGTRAPAGGGRLVWLALPWLAVPPAVLLAVSEIKPVYDSRYVIFCLPAAALLAGGGLAALGRASSAVALTLIAALSLPAQLAWRVPGGDMREAAQILSANTRPGDGIVYPSTGIPPWYLAYPASFQGVRDVGMGVSGAVLGHLYGAAAPLPTVRRREDSLRRLWVVEIGWPRATLAPYLAPGFRLAREWQPDHGAAKLWLFTRTD